MCSVDYLIRSDDSLNILFFCVFLLKNEILPYCMAACGELCCVLVGAAAGRMPALLCGPGPRTEGRFGLQWSSVLLFPAWLLRAKFPGVGPALCDQAGAASGGSADGSAATGLHG